MPSSTAQGDWSGFEHGLQGALARMTDGDVLVISVKDAYGYVQFQHRGQDGARMEALSNNFINDPDVQLTPDTEAILKKLGWQAPTTTGEEDPHGGSPNFYTDSPSPIDPAGLSRRAVETLRLVYRVSGPELLQYEAFSSDGDALSYPALTAAHDTPIETALTDEGDAQGVVPHDDSRDALEVPLAADTESDECPTEGCPTCRELYAQRHTVSKNLIGTSIERIEVDTSRYLSVFFESATIDRCDQCGTSWLEQYWELETPETQLEEWGERHWASTPLSPADVRAIEEAAKKHRPLQHNFFWSRPNSLRRTNKGHPYGLGVREP